MKTTLLKTLTPELNLVQHNDIPVLHLKHAVGTAKKFPARGTAYQLENRKMRSKMYYG